LAEHLDAPRVTLSIRPVLVNRQTAAAMVAMSVDSFERYVQPALRLVGQGKLRLVPVSELERWAADNAEPLFRGVTHRIGQRLSE
jgi:hypothetical protein